MRSRIRQLAREGRAGTRHSVERAATALLFGARFSIAIASLWAAALAQPPKVALDPLFKDAHIALRLGTGRVLIVGGETRTDFSLATRAAEGLSRLDEADALVPGTLFIVPPEKAGQFLPTETGFRIGQRWKLYLGAGPPVTVTVRNLIMTDSGGGELAYAAAVAEFESPDVANRVAGLRAAEYLAAPPSGLPNVSGTPLVPSFNGLRGFPSVEDILLAEARKVVTDENWKVAPWDTLAEQTRTKNRLLHGPAVRHEYRFMRWNPPGSKPLLFIEALWRNPADDSPLFGADAVVEVGNPLKLISFDSTKAEQMRMGIYAQFGPGIWNIGETTATLGQAPTFLNAWKIGGRCFVLTYRKYYESFDVALKEIVPGVGLLPVGVGFGGGGG